MIGTRLSRFSWAGSLALTVVLFQGTPPPSGPSPALIVLLIAVVGSLIIGAGIALLLWFLSLRAPHAAVGAEPKVTKSPREVLPAGVHLPSPSIQPLILALGMTIFVFGVVLRGIAIQIAEGFSIPIIMVLGLLIIIAGFIGWIREDHRAARQP